VTNVPSVPDPPPLPDRLDPHDHVVAWLYHAVSHEAVTLARKRGCESRAIGQLVLQAAEGDPSKMSHRERRAVRALAALQKVALQGRFLLWAHACGYSYEELAVIEGVNVNTLSSMMHRARIAFRKYYIADSMFALPRPTKL